MAINLACTTPTVRCTLQLEGVPPGKDIKQALKVYGVEVERTSHLEDSPSSRGPILVTIKASDESEYIYNNSWVLDKILCFHCILACNYMILCAFIVWV